MALCSRESSAVLGSSSSSESLQASQTQSIPFLLLSNVHFFGLCHQAAQSGRAAYQANLQTDPAQTKAVPKVPYLHMHLHMPQ